MSKSLWSANFASNCNDFGSGVLTIDDNLIYGGDQGYFYLGDCSISSNTATASITISKHNPRVSSVFGPIDNFTLKVSGSGSIDAGMFNLTGNVVESPNMNIQITLRKLANL